MTKLSDERLAEIRDTELWHVQHGAAMVKELLAGYDALLSENERLTRELEAANLFLWMSANASSVTKRICSSPASASPSNSCRWPRRRKRGADADVRP